MDMVVEHTKQKENLSEVMQTINHVRIYKKMFLIYELLGLNSKTNTKACEQICEESSFR